MRHLRTFACVACLVALIACGSDKKAPRAASTSDAVACEGHAITCRGTVEVRCEDGEEVTTDCDTTLEVCSTSIGCTHCAPSSGRCDGETAQVCSKRGERWVDGETCSGKDGVHCQAGTGRCANLCAEAAATKSYVGCEYFPVSAANIVDKAFDYAVIVSNPQSVPAEIQLRAAKSESTPAFEDSAVIPPGKLKTFRLPWRLHGEAMDASLKDTAYQLTSSVPVTAYQFNPLEFRVDGDCTDSKDPLLGDDACYSFTNDASLLLPSSALGSSYMLVAPSTGRATDALVDGNGDAVIGSDGEPLSSDYAQTSTATIVATADTGVTVIPSVKVLSSEGTFAPGEEITLKLRKGEATQLFFLAPTSTKNCAGRSDDQEVDFPCAEGSLEVCSRHRRYCEGADPTGTRIQSDKPIAVYTGSPCSFIPYNRRACDHLEEALPPLRTWGEEVVVGVTRPIKDEPNVLRIVSATDGNKLVFDPEDVHAKVELGAGEVLEIQTTESFKVTGTAPLLVAQYLVGEEDHGIEAWADASTEQRLSGDPSLSFAVPIEQHRRDFDFLTPDTYDSSYVTIVAPRGGEVSVDGTFVTGGWKAIGKSGFLVVHRELQPGPHHVRGTFPIAAQVYGFGAYTSYMFPAGLNLEQVNELF